MIKTLLWEAARHSPLKKINLKKVIFHTKSDIREIIKGNPDQSHFIFEANVGKRPIRQRTIDFEFKIYGSLAKQA